jgi:hypothetical protein
MTAASIALKNRVRCIPIMDFPFSKILARSSSATHPCARICQGQRIINHMSVTS